MLGCSKGLFLAVRDHFQGSEAAVGATSGCVEALLAGLGRTLFDLVPSQCALGRSWAALGLLLAAHRPLLGVLGPLLCRR